MTIPNFSMRQLLEAGVHFGHSPRRWNPKMAPFIFGVRNNVHIINLEATVACLKDALAALHKVASSGGRILFVGTKHQAQQAVAESATRCGQYYINHRWLGGTLTNWQTVSNSISRLKKVSAILEQGDTAGFTKKEVLKLTRERDKLQAVLGGITEMAGLPDILVILDANKDSLAIEECNKLGIPVVAVLDSNSSPEGVTYPVPGNDDAVKALELYCQLFSSAVLGGLQEEMAASGVDLGAAQDVAAFEEAPAAASAQA